MTAQVLGCNGEHDVQDVKAHVNRYGAVTYKAAPIFTTTAFPPVEYLQS